MLPVKTFIPTENIHDHLLSYCDLEPDPAVRRGANATAISRPNMTYHLSDSATFIIGYFQFNSFFNIDDCHCCLFLINDNVDYLQIKLTIDL